MCGGVACTVRVSRPVQFRDELYHFFAHLRDELYHLLSKLPRHFRSTSLVRESRSSGRAVMAHLPHAPGGDAFAAFSAASGPDAKLMAKFLARFVEGYE